jgi:hypothetical protein
MFILDYEILKYFSQMYCKIFDTTQIVSSVALSKKMTETYGDTEIVKRSTRAFFKTLTDFGILKAQSLNQYEQVRKTLLTHEQIADILELYAIVNNSKQINLKTIDKTVFSFYAINDLSVVAHKYHTCKWEYIKGVDRELLMMK